MSADLHPTAQQLCAAAGISRRMFFNALKVRRNGCEELNDLVKSGDVSMSLALEVARQFVRDNNGRLLMSRAYMATRGCKSMDMLNKCKAELLEAGFIFQTVQGHRPNKASWYAVTWCKRMNSEVARPGMAKTLTRFNSTHDR